MDHAERLDRIRQADARRQAAASAGYLSDEHREASRTLNAELAAGQEEGLSLRRMAVAIGVSHNMVGQRITAHLSGWATPWPRRQQVRDLG